jgi:autophagy-related protein 5
MVVQEVAPPFEGGAGGAVTLGGFLQTHLPLLFPPPAPRGYFGASESEEVYALAFPIVQGVVVPPETEMAWLGACMVGADGWVSVCVGLK